MKRRPVATIAAAIAIGLLPAAASSAVDSDAAGTELSAVPGLYAANILVEGLNPFDLSLDPATGFLWVVEGFGGISVYDHAGNRVASIPRGSGPGEVNEPTAIEVADGEVFVTEYGEDRVQVFDTRGSHLRYWGESGSAPGQFDGPCGIEIVGTQAFVADGGNDRIQVFNKDSGKYWSEFGEPGSGNGQLAIGCESDLLTHHGDEIIVVDDENERLTVFTTGGKWLGHIGAGEFAQITGADAVAGAIWVTDAAKDRVSQWTPSGVLVNSFGTPGTALGELQAPVSLVVDPSGDTIWIGEDGNNRIQTFTVLRCAGRPLTHVGTSYADVLTTGAGDDVVGLGPGDDTLSTRAGSDVACGGPGADTIRGGGNTDLLFGGKGADLLYGGKGADTIKGGSGPDSIEGRGGGDAIYGGRGRDTLRGNAGNDNIWGNAGNDTLFGGTGSDVCKGNLGTDTAKACESTFGVP